MSGVAENTAAKLRGRPFRRGQSGNPSGKPKGARHKTTLAVQALLEGEAEAISRKAIELAKAGDMTAIRLVLERILPQRKDAPVKFDLPEANTVEDVARAMSHVMQMVGEGELIVFLCGRIMRISIEDLL